MAQRRVNILGLGSLAFYSAIVIALCVLFYFFNDAQYIKQAIIGWAVYILFFGKIVRVNSETIFFIACYNLFRLKKVSITSVKKVVVSAHFSSQLGTQLIQFYGFKNELMHECIVLFISRDLSLLENILKQVNVEVEYI